MKIIHAYVLCACGALSALAQSPTNMVSNLGQTANSTGIFGSFIGTHMSRAGSFTTDNTAGLLSAVTVNLNDAVGQVGNLGPCVIALHRDSNGAPGNLLASLSGPAYPTTPGVYTYTNTSPVTLLPNTTYWIVASSPGSVNDAAYGFRLANTNGTDPGSFWTIGTHKYKIGTDNWAAAPSYCQIRVTAIPLPPNLSASLEIGAQTNYLVLSFPTPDVPFYLQQTPELAKAAWDLVPSYAEFQEGMTSIVRMPIRAGSMYFRLHDPPPNFLGRLDWWQGEGNFIDLVGLLHGTSTNPPTFTSGQRGSGFAFDGLGQGLELEGSPLSVPWTACFWVNRQDAVDGSAVLLGDSQTALKLEQWQYTRRVGFTQYGTADYSFNYSTPTNTWVHLAMVGTAAGTVLYTNGVAVETNAATINLPRGRMGFNGGDHMRGALDEVMLFDHALTPAEIQQVRDAAGNP